MSEESGKIDLGVKDLHAEEVKALYFDSEALIEPPYKLFRLDSKGGNRNYYRFDEKNNPEFFISVTTFIGRSMPMNFHLLKWYADMGMQRAEEHKNERADYGTYMHGVIEKLTIARKYDLDKLYDDLVEYAQTKGRGQEYADKWYFEMKKDILAWAQFLIDYNVKPLAIEVMLCSPKYGYAGAIDLLCEMDFEFKGFYGEVYKSGVRKGEPKETKETRRIKAIVDAKSGKKGFFEGHEVQLHAYKNMFEENYPDIKIDKVFNWAGNEWRGVTPTYKLKDQTDSKLALKLKQFVELAQIDEATKDDTGFTIIQGVIDLDKGLESNIKELTKSELVQNKQK